MWVKNEKEEYSLRLCFPFSTSVFCVKSLFVNIGYFEQNAIMVLYHLFNKKTGSIITALCVEH